MLKKEITIDRIEVIENGCVQIRTKTAIMENGIQIGGGFHRHVVAPGDIYTSEDMRVQAICAAVHTPELIAAYQATLEVARL